MTEHSKRLLTSVFHSIESYKHGRIDEIALMQDIEGACGAIEEHDIETILDAFVVSIEDSRYLFDEDEGKEFLLKKIQELKQCLSQ